MGIKARIPDIKRERNSGHLLLLSFLFCGHYITDIPPRVFYLLPAKPAKNKKKEEANYRPISLFFFF